MSAIDCRANGHVWRIEAKDGTVIGYRCETCTMTRMDLFDRDPDDPAAVLLRRRFTYDASGIDR